MRRPACAVIAAVLPMGLAATPLSFPEGPLDYLGPRELGASLLALGLPLLVMTVSMESTLNKCLRSTC